VTLHGQTRQERRAAAREETRQRRAAAQEELRLEREADRREQARELLGFSEVPDRDLADEELWRLPPMLEPDAPVGRVGSRRR
jgi:hypothetical protein